LTQATLIYSKTDLGYVDGALNITPARLALINADVDGGDFIILVGSSSDALNALAEFARQVYQT